MQSRATRVTVLRTAALMILKLVNPLELLEDRIACSYIIIIFCMFVTL